MFIQFLENKNMKNCGIMSKIMNNYELCHKSKNISFESFDCVHLHQSGWYFYRAFKAISVHCNCMQKTGLESLQNSSFSAAESHLERVLNNIIIILR